jgi:RHS repeat-associated protein
VGATPYSIGYGYDADNRQTQVIYPNGAVVDRTFTDRNQLESVAYNGVNAAILDYDNAGRLSTKTFGNGLVETRTYQADNLNTSINTPGVTAFGYTWDANKRKLSQTETGIPLNNQTYSYDDEDRLASFNRNNGDNQAWALSLVGDWNQFNNNGVMENRTHNAVHEITTIDATPLVHDVKGNLTTNKNGQVYAWDIENRLVSATVPAGCPEGVTGTHTYTYDALGRRVSKTVGGNTTVFISDGMQEITEYVNGAFSQSYVYGSYIDEPLLKTDSAGNKIYYHANNLFSIAALTDNAGTVVERYKYDPYGKATILAADGITVRTFSLYNNVTTYTGRRLDIETGLIHFRYRMWDYNFGQFVNRDPLGYIDGMSLYRGYFALNGVDPLGLGWSDYVYKIDIGDGHVIIPSIQTGRPKCYRCGPDITGWLLIELLQLDNWVADVVRANSNNRMHFRGQLRWDLIRAIAPRLTYFPNTTFESKHCPAEDDCKNTVTFMGVCMHKSEVGNIAYGFIARSFLFHRAVAWAGGVYGNRGDRTNADAASIELGYLMGDAHYDETKEGRLLSIEDFFKKNSGLLWMSGSDAPKHCLPCNESVDPLSAHTVILPVNPTSKLKSNDIRVAVPSKVSE